MLPDIKGRISWVFTEKNFDIDLIVGVENMKVKDLGILKSVAMKEFDPSYIHDVREGDVIVGGENFGYGHPHYPSCRALRALGVKAIIAESFSPGFYRGESTNGFPLIECPGILKVAKRWNMVQFNWETEKLSFLEKNLTLTCERVPQKTKDLLVHGGIIEYLKNTRLKTV